MALGMPQNAVRIRFVVEEPGFYRAEVTLRDLSRVEGWGYSYQDAEDNALNWGSSPSPGLRLSRDKSRERTQDRPPPCNHTLE